MSCQLSSQSVQCMEVLSHLLFPWESDVVNEGFKVLKEPLVEVSANAALIEKWIYCCEFHWIESDHMDDLSSDGRNQKCYRCLYLCVCLLTWSSRSDHIARIAIKNDTTIKLSWEEHSNLQFLERLVVLQLCLVHCHTTLRLQTLMQLQEKVNTAQIYVFNREKSFWRFLTATQFWWSLDTMSFYFPSI